MKWRRRVVSVFSFRRSAVVSRLRLRNAKCRREIKELRRQAESSLGQANTADARYLQSEQQRELAEGEIEVLKSQIEDMLAWRQVELERMQTEATMHAIKRGKLEAGELTPD